MHPKMYWLLLFFSSLVCYAQTIDTSTHIKAVDYHFQYLSKTPITTGVLYDRVFPTNRLDLFNQGTRQDTSSYYHFLQTHSEIYTAHYTAPTTRLPTTDELRAYAQTVTESGTVPLSILAFDFNHISPSALTQNLISYSNGFYYDVASRPTSPYLQKRLIEGAALTDKIRTGATSFRLPSELVFTNAGLSVTNVVIDFANGGAAQTLTPGGSAVTVSYSSGGDKALKLTINFSNGTQKVTYALLTVFGPSTCTSCRSNEPDYKAQFPPCFRERVNATIAFTPYETEVFSTQPGQLEAMYYYASNKTCLNNGTTKINVTQPIIVLDGFDPGDDRPGEELYGEYLKYSVNSNQDANLGDVLRAKNSDVIIVNFPKYTIGNISLGWFNTSIAIKRDGGADYVERNAFALIALIQNINQQLQASGSTKKITIIGPSMGGLISRYALAYMEKNNLNHNTDLWVSFDSPHQGANIPIGAQAFLKYFGSKGVQQAQKNLDDKIGSKAARQMLVHHHLAGQQVVAGAPGYRDRFVTALTTNGVTGSNGFPQIPRRVALINGAINGTRFSNTSCERILNMESTLTVNVLGLFKIYTYVQVAKAEINYSGNSGNTCKVFYGYITREKGQDVFANAPSNTISYDISPGGSFDTPSILAKEGSYKYQAQQILPVPIQVQNLILAYTLLPGTTTNFQVLKPTHSFIPTKSSLAFTGTSKDLGENLSGRNLVCSGETPFHAYYAPTTNEVHVTLTNANATWILNEIEKKPEENPLPGYAITGPAMLCQDGSYSISPAFPAGTSVVWSSLTPNVTITQAGLATRQNNYTGAFTIKAVVNSSCGKGTFTFSGQAQNGPATPTWIAHSAQGRNSTMYVNASIADVPGATAYKWYIDYVYKETTTSPSWYYEGPGACNSVHYVTASAVHPCYPDGLSATYGVTVSCGGGGIDLVAGQVSLVVYPNPASDQITVVSIKSDSTSTANGAQTSDSAANGSVKAQSTFSQSKTSFTETDIVDMSADLTLVNNYNQIVWQGKLEKGRASFNITKLQTGIYYLKTKTPTFNQTQMVQILR
ncbi:hypothetical protein QNI19_32300 [Cytophagaceae bacterium DM2B3-1]|uniref:DUF676 domain-containing protein n=1 Tax=Xanthocytophaga flava TaxID=3048013 RepID=A0ABT7CVH4_9BACT|nr:T9SS type A sorting domain-containing protein [Xanthocytophaga flavus]MDJ1497666.1 hypothetical protein [Xanthocytophaga flavus]